MSAAGKKLQHSVPRFYLKRWAEGEKVYCLQEGKIRLDVVRNLGAENYFYRLNELTSGDLDFLHEFIKDSPQGLRASHEQLLRVLMLPFEERRRLKAPGLATQEKLAEINREIIELNENLHTSIEDDFQPCLNAMISGDLTFREDDQKAAVFYRSLSVQYARTNHIKQTRVVMNPERLSMYLRIANPLVHILAANVGLNLYAERRDHSILILENETRVPFVTGDQPVINVASGPKDTAPPARFELYYPLSPKRAMLLVQPSSDLQPESSSVSEEFVRIRNLRMAAHSYRQVFSISPAPLESIKNELPAYMGCFPGEDRT